MTMLVVARDLGPQSLRGYLKTIRRAKRVTTFLKTPPYMVTHVPNSFPLRPREGCVSSSRLATVIPT